MAVVFVSPKKRQRTFFLVMGLAALGIFGLVFVWIFLAGPSKSKVPITFNKPKVTVNLTSMDSDQFRQLEPFTPIPLQFAYEAENRVRQKVKGVISATSEEEARKALEANGLVVGKIGLIIPGRDNPFTPYATTQP